jgi:hypothetical protein
MIGFNHLGQMGRLGNQMFQCAALLGISNKRGFDYCIPNHSMFNDYGGYRHHELQGCFKMKHFDGKYGLVDGDLVQLDQYHFCHELLYECPDNVTLIGYFESEKYFHHIEDKVRENYQFLDFIQEQCYNYGKDYLKDYPVGLVVRRGDFLSEHNKNRHKVCDIEYYEKSLKLFKGRTILVFSDDITWCKKQEIFQDKNIFFVDKSLNIYKGHFDLCLLSMCQDFIIANSTFSWWGAWLSINKNKKVIAPRIWYGPELEHLIIKDQLPETWERI